MKTREFSISTDHEGMYNITARLREVIRESGVQSGLAVVYCPHTTAGITINENADPDVQHDLLLDASSGMPRAIRPRTSSAAMSARARPCSSRTASPSSASGRACISASSTVRAIAATILR